jgi:thiol:disulfide interchange protein DsbG
MSRTLVILFSLGIGVCVPVEANEATQYSRDGSAFLKLADNDQSTKPEVNRLTPLSSDAGVDVRIDGATGAQDPAFDGVLGPPTDVEHVPALKYLAAKGAKLLDLGSAHGLRSVVARQGDEIMFFLITPDGQALVAGLESELSVGKLLTVARTQVSDLGAAHGLRTLFLRNGGEFQVLYATPDGERLIAGVMWDANGKNITRGQVSSVEGAAPTAVVGYDPRSGSSASALELVQKTAFGLLGNQGGPRLWVFVDPLCTYSVRAMQELKPFVERGLLQLALIPVSVLDYETGGQSTPAALALLAKPADEMAAAWSHRDFKTTGAPDAAERLRENMAAAAAIGLKGTPTLIWRKADGSEGRIDGMATDWKAVIASMGGNTHASGE